MRFNFALDRRDRAQLRARGIGIDEALRQLSLLASPPPRVQLDRACTLGDGLTRIAPEDHEPLRQKAAEAARLGRLSKFVPASGAASRMFESPLAMLVEAGEQGLRAETLRQRAEAGEKTAEDTLRLIQGLDRLAFRPALAASLERKKLDLEALLAAGRYGLLLEHLLLARGLGYGETPKALVPFHLTADGPLTAFEEHLAEAASFLADDRGVSRLHFTVPERARRDFEKVMERFVRGPGPRYGRRFEVGFSHQEASTDTLALLDGVPARQEDGCLLFRPGGHGALLPNLQRAGGDIVLIKNIDNVLPAWRRAEVVDSEGLLIGLLLDVEATLHRLLAALSGYGPFSAELIAEAVRFCREVLCHEPPRDLPLEGVRAFLIDRFDRPLRVCGMVENRGEPGGGPFWVEEPSGEVTRQIVELAQVDRDTPDQDAIVRSAAFFNPVDLVCSLRDRSGRPFRLASFADPSVAFVAQKPWNGQQLSALEHPGLWNGGMARWNTLFVEIPAETFAPVKSVLDLLRPEHQPAG